MLFNLEVLASALLLTAVFGIAVGTTKHLEIVAQPKGLNPSSNQGTVDWKAVIANRVFLLYVKAAEGTSKVVISSSRGALIPRSGQKNSCSSPQYTGAANAGLIAAATTLPFQISPLVLESPLGPTGSPPTVVRLLGDSITPQVALDIECTDRVFNLLDPPTDPHRHRLSDRQPTCYGLTTAPMV